MSSEFYDIANIGNSPPIPSPPLPDYRNLYLSEAKLFLPRPLALPPPSPSRVYTRMIDAARRPTDSIHPVYFPRIFRRFLEAAANVRRYLICARPPAVPAGWMIDHPGILTQTARLRQSSFPPIRLMTKARMKRASLFLFEELGATERERERMRGNEGNGSTRCLYQFLRLRPRCRGNLCNKGSRRTEGGRGVISPFKAAPLPLPARLAFR